MHGRPKDLRSRMTPKLGSARCGTLDSRFNCSELHFLTLQNGNGDSTHSRGDTALMYSLS